MNLNHATNKTTGSSLSATEWNNLAADVNELGAGNSGSSVVSVAQDTDATDPTVNVSIASGVEQIGNPAIILLTKKSKGVNATIVSGNNLNVEPAKDFLVKAGDDIALYAHHRDAGSKDQVLIKVLTEGDFIKNGSTKTDDVPAKLRINSGDISITNKDNKVMIMVEILTEYNKDPDYNIVSDIPANTFVNGYIYEDAIIGTKLSGIIIDDNINAIKGTAPGKSKVIYYTDGALQDPVKKYYKFTKMTNNDGITNINFEDKTGYGYLKVRAQSIDLRCEEHGGIALQPKGDDGSGHMNKIKFEHGGGDGLEFGTFNTEKTSLFTKEYRFNKDGKILLATRTTQASDKADANDSTTAYKYVKQADDFYDVIYEGESGNEFYNYDPTDVADTSVTWGDIVKYIAWAKTNNEGPWAVESPQL